jgi:YfiH family protein
MPIDPQFSYRHVNLPSGREIGYFKPLDAIDGVVHAVTTKRGPLFPPEASLGEPLYRELAAEMGCGDVAWCEQVHGGRVLRVTTGGCAGEADGLITSREDLLLLCRSADCPLILAAARDGSVVGVAHASWRGTVAGVARVLVEAMLAEFGCDPADVIACICPSAGPEKYEVGPEVRQAAIETLGPNVRWHFTRSGTDDRTYLFDLWSANTSQLMAAGVPLLNIYASQVCTITHHQHYPSYRVEGQAAERFVAAIARS